MAPPEPPVPGPMGGFCSTSGKQATRSSARVGPRDLIEPSPLHQGPRGAVRQQHPHSVGRRPLGPAGLAAAWVSTVILHSDI